MALFVGCGREQETPAQAPANGAYDAQGARPPGSPEPAAKPNVVVIVLDTLRADAVLGRDGRPGRMPYLAALGREGMDFRAATAPASWTMPSLTSFLTGLAPHVHRCVELGGTVAVREEVTTFAEALGAGYGYETRAFVGLSPHAASTTILDGYSSVTAEFSLQAVEAEVGPWAQKRDPQRPFLLLLHTYDAHEPYGQANHAWPKPGKEAAFAAGNPLEGPPAPWEVVRRCLLEWRANAAIKTLRYRALQEQYLRSGWSGLEADPQPALLEELKAAYDVGTVWVDDLLRGTVARLEALGLLRDTLLVVASDHGEAFGEHGILLHGRQLHEELLHVPLVIVPYGRQKGGAFAGPRVVEECVGLVDVFPTLFDGLKLAPVGEGQGSSFLDLVRGKGEARPVFSHVRVTPETTGGEADQQAMSVRTGAWKYLLTCDFGKGTVREELYDLRKDPAERSPVPLASGDAAAVGSAFARAVEQVRDHFWRASEPRVVLCDLPGTPGLPVRVARPPPLVGAASDGQPPR